MTEPTTCDYCLQTKPVTRVDGIWGKRWLCDDCRQRHAGLVKDGEPWAQTELGLFEVKP